MLGFVQNWFGPKGSPIGVDFGSETLRLVQVAKAGVDWKIVAAASADVPPQIRHDAAGRIAFFIDAVREMLACGNFRGRRAVLALPSASIFYQHLRLPKMDEEAIRKALPWEARGKLPIDPSHAVLRHIIAGDVYHDQDPKSEVIVMAANRDLVDQFLAMASRAKLEVVGMNVEPQALLDGFAHLERQKDAEVTNCFVDIGAAGSRAVITRGKQVLFARAIPIGGDHFNRAVAANMKMGLEDAKLLRIRLATALTAQPPAAPEPAIETPVLPAETDSNESGFALLNAAMSRSATPTAPVAENAETAAPAGEGDEAARVQQAIREPLGKLIDELNLCRRYHESTFPNRPVDRLIFVGGEAQNRSLCQAVARQMGLAAQVGDPLTRVVRSADTELPLDLRQPQPAWAVAIGLSMGPGAVAGSKSRTTAEAAKGE